MFVISLKLHSCCFVHTMIIQYNTVPFLTPEPNFSNSYYSSAIRIFALLELYIQTHNPIPVFYNLVYAFSSPAPSTKFSLSKTTGCTIR